MSQPRYEGVLSPAQQDAVNLNSALPGRVVSSRCTNPNGLPAGSYVILEFTADSASGDAMVQTAVNAGGAQWTRRSSAFPSTWSAWNATSGGGGGGTVTSVSSGGPAIVVTNPAGPAVTVSASPSLQSVDAVVSGFPSPGYLFNSAPGVVVEGAIGSSATVTATTTGLGVTTLAVNPANVVTSFNGRAGAVLPVLGDYTSSLVTNLSGVAGATDTAALNALNAGKQPLAANLTALAALASTGVMVETAPGAYSTRTLQAGAGIAITNPDGVAGNPVISATSTATVSSVVAGDASVVVTNGAGPVVTLDTSAALQALSTLGAAAGTGLLVQTAPNTFVDRSLVAGAGLTITNPSGVAGNPTIAETNPLPAGTNPEDFLIWNGASWVSSTASPAGKIATIGISTLNELVPGTRIGGTAGLSLQGDGVNSIMFEFFGGGPGPSADTGMFEIASLDVPFTAPGAVLHIDANNSTTLSGGTRFIECHNGAAAVAPYPGAIVFAVGSDGTVNGLAFTVWSRRASKKHIKELVLDSRSLRKLCPSTFHYKAEKDDAPVRCGLIADEVEDICPEALNPAKDGLDIAGLSGLAFAYLKDLEARVAKLEAALH